MLCDKTVSQFWTPVVNAFQRAALQPYQENIDALFVTRDNDPLQNLIIRTNPQRAITQFVLTGQKGSGKSSELASFAHLLKDNYNYFVVWLNVIASFGGDLTNLTHLEIISMMGFAVYKVAEDQGLRPDSKLKENLIDSLTTLIRERTENDHFQLDVGQLLSSLACFGLGLLVGPAAAVAASTMLHAVNQGGARFSLGADERRIRRLEQGAKLNNVIAAVRAIITHVEEKANKPLFLIVDGLDFIHDIDLARYLFGESWVLSTPPCRVIYAAPVILSYSPDFTQVRTQFCTVDLPNIKVRDYPKVGPYKDGYNTVRQVVCKRFDSIGMRREDAITDDALNLLIEYSGGVMVLLFMLIQDSITEAEVLKMRQINSAVAITAISRLQQTFFRTLGEAERAELRRVSHDHTRFGSELGDRLLMNLYILCYLNLGSDPPEWYDVNPLLQKWL